MLFWHESPNDRAALRGIRAALADRDHPHELIVREADERHVRRVEILRRPTPSDDESVHAAE